MLIVHDLFSCPVKCAKNNIYTNTYSVYSMYKHSNRVERHRVQHTNSIIQHCKTVNGNVSLWSYLHIKKKPQKTDEASELCIPPLPHRIFHLITLSYSMWKTLKGILHFFQLCLYLLHLCCSVCISTDDHFSMRSEARRVGKECVSTF